MDKGRFFAIVQKIKREGLNSAASGIADSKMPEFVFFAFWTRTVASDTDTAGRAWAQLTTFVRENTLPACKLSEADAITAALQRLNNQGSRPQRAICVVKIRASSSRWDKWAEDWVVSGIREVEIVGWGAIPITWLHRCEGNEFGMYYLDPDDDD